MNSGEIIKKICGTSESELLAWLAECPSAACVPGALAQAIVGRKSLLARELLRLGASPDDQRSEDDAWSAGEPAVVAAGDGKDDGLLEELLASGADIDGNELYSSTPIGVACRTGSTSTIRMLVDRGADLEREDAAGSTPLEKLWAWDVTTPDVDRSEAFELLTSLGGYVAFGDIHIWSGHPHQSFLEKLEARLGAIHPKYMVGQALGSLHRVYRARFNGGPMGTMDHQLLIALSDDIPMTLGIALYCTWPSNRRALQQRRFAWPYEVLLRLADARKEGRAIEHGMVIESDDPVFGGYCSAPYGLLVVKSDLFQVDPGYPGYMLAPLERKPPIETAKLRALADRMKRTPWKRLHQSRPSETEVPARLLAIPPEPTAMKLVLSEERAKALYELPEDVAAAIRASLPEPSWGRKKKAATKKAATKKAATKKAATKKAATKKPATKKPATKKPATKKPATKNPATKNPATKNPATKKARRG